MRYGWLVSSTTSIQLIDRMLCSSKGRWQAWSPLQSMETLFFGVFCENIGMVQTVARTGLPLGR